MRKELLDDSFDELNTLVGLEIIECHRKIFDTYEYTDDLTESARDFLQQALDGNMCLSFVNGQNVLFAPCTETFSLKYEKDITDFNGYTDVSRNSFWKGRTGSTIVRIALIYSEFRANPYGVRFELSNGMHFELVYVSETEYTSDALVVRGDD